MSSFQFDREHLDSIIGVLEARDLELVEFQAMQLKIANYLRHMSSALERMDELTQALCAAHALGRDTYMRQMRELLRDTLQRKP